MRSRGEIDRWSEVLLRLVRGPSPRGETFDLCRRVLTVAPESPEATAAGRTLLEGAMADAATPIADAQEVMGILRALDRLELTIRDILPR